MDDLLRSIAYEWNLSDLDTNVRSSLIQTPLGQKVSIS